MPEKETKNKQLIISLGILMLILFAGFFGADKPFLAQAGSSQNVSGFAWSENIGWISFNSSSDDSGVDYGANIDPTTGAFSGYAWSENIGWIDFAPTSGFPEAPNSGAKLDLATNQVSGWAKAVAGGSSGSGGWDGWIKMSGTAANGSPYGGSRNGCSLEGYAWGGDVVGWIQFDPINIDCQNIPPDPPVITTLSQNQAPAVTLTANPSTINSGDSSTLTWTTTNNPDSCSASGSWSGNKSASGGSESVSPTANSTYTITCSKTGFADISASATITVSAAPAYSLNVSKTGAGLGAVTSNLGGIDCGSTCSVDFTSGASVTLTASASLDSIFTGWSGEGCSGAGTCTVTMSASRNVIAAFSSVIPPPTFSFNPSSVSINRQLLCGQTNTYYSGIIKVESFNGFSDNVNLSVRLTSGSLPTGITTADYGVSDNTITSAEYFVGFKFWINVPAAVCQPIKDVIFRVLGNGGESSAQVQVSIGSISPTFREN